MRRFHSSLPLSFKTEPKTQPRNRYSAPAVAAMKANRRALLTLIALIVISPLVIAGVVLLLKHYHYVR